MSKVFLYYASEDKASAEAIQLALVSEGHTVFFDDQSLPAGGDYQRRIRDAIASCDLFVFLASPASVAPSKFTLTELEFARRRWPSPVDRVILAILRELQPADLPPYLKAATVLTVRGNAAAEVRASVSALVAHRSRWMRRARIGTGISVVLAAGVFTITRKDQPQNATSEPSAAQPWTPMQGEIRFDSDSGDSIGDGRAHVLSDTNGVITALVSDSTISVAFEGDEHWTLEFNAPRGQSLERGSYPNAQRAPFNNPLKPGLSISGAGRGCNELDGEFLIRDVVTGAAAGPELVAVEFTQRCEGGRAALRGVLVLKAAPR